MSDKKKYYDFHLHSRFSYDSEADPEEEIKHAISVGLTGMCFTEHNDFDYREPDGSPAFDLQLDIYIEKIKELKDKYKNSLEIGIGLEQGLTLPASERIEKYDPEGVLDFIIGSTHVVDSLDPYYPEFWESHDAASGIRRYYENIYDCVNVINNYDVYGHLDYITRYLPGRYKKNDETYEAPMSFRTNVRNDDDYYTATDIMRLTPMELVQEILKKLIYKGKGIEINTAGWRKGENPNPAPYILKEYKRLGGEIITIGSDAHESENIGYGIKKAHTLLAECGFKYFTILKNRKPYFYAL